MSKTRKISGPGFILDRSAKKGKLKIEFDVSPNAFVTESRTLKEKLQVTILADGVKPIVLAADARQWCLLLEQAAIPPERLAELEDPITEATSVHVTLEYSPKQPDLPGLEGQ